jgi:predicted permease
MMTSLLNDVRYALRQLRKSPGFTATAVLTLALGIGATTAIFTLVHAILLRSLPVGNPSQLYRIGDRDQCCVWGSFVPDNGDMSIFPYDLYLNFKQAAPEFEQLAAVQAGTNAISVRHGGATAKAATSEYVSGNYFSTLGVGAFAGRMLSAADDKPSAPAVAVLSYQSWQTDYTADPSIVGSTFYIQGQPVTVIGIAPAGFFGDRVTPDPPAFWIPLAAEPAIVQSGSLLHHHDSCWLYAIGRVRSGTAILALQQKLSASLRRWLLTQPAFVKRSLSTIPRAHVVLTPAGTGIQSLQQQEGSGLRVLMILSALVLLIACANVANLMLVRGMARRGEMSVRMALGAAQARLVRQLLTESVLLSCIGGLAGLAIAYVGTHAILSLAFPDSPGLPIHASPSLPVLAFAFTVSVLTGIFFGIAPAWTTSHLEPAEALRGVNRSTGERSSLPQKSLVVFQAALSLVLILGAGLLTKSLRNLEHQSLGISTADRYVMHLDPAGAGYTPARLQALDQQLEQRLSAIPGVRSVGLATYSPLDGDGWTDCAYVEGRSTTSSMANCAGASWDRVSPHFFESVGQQVLRGRGITAHDTATSPFAVVVNQAFVKKVFPNEDPIGKHFGTIGPQYANDFEIVGVVADAKYFNARDDFQPMFFRPLTQQVTTYKEASATSGEVRSLDVHAVVIRLQGPQANIESVLRRTMASIDPNLAIVSLEPLEQQVFGNFNQDRLMARLTDLFGLLALVLASIGLYGVTAFSLARRTREIGLRMALGASRPSVVSMMLRGALYQMLFGLAVGIPIALVGGHFIASQLYGVQAYDPLSWMIAILVLSTCALVAGFIPSRRAASIDPMQTLRSE